MSPEREFDQPKNPEKNERASKKGGADDSRSKSGSKPAAEENRAPDEKASEKGDADIPLKEEAHSDPTRFGDWEKKGRCIDF